MIFFHQLYYRYNDYYACLLSQRGDPIAYVKEDGSIVTTDGQLTGWWFQKYPEDHEYVGEIDFGGSKALINRENGKLIFSGPKEPAAQEEDNVAGETPMEIPERPGEIN